MAIASVKFEGIRLNDAEALGSVWTDLGGGKASLETDFRYQGSNSVSEKVGTSEGGVAYTDPTGVDLSTTPTVFLAKVLATTSGILNNIGATGGKIELGSGGTRANYNQYYVVGGDTYPIKGGWLIIPVDPNATASNTPGTAPTLTSIDYFGWATTFTGTSKVENVIMDAVDTLPSGKGLVVEGGTGADPVASISNFVSFDEGTSTNRYGIIATTEGANIINGTLSIGGDSAGASAQTSYTDNNEVIIFPGALFLSQPGFFGINYNLHNSSTTITINNCFHKSEGDSAQSDADTRPDYIVGSNNGTLTVSGAVYDTFRKFEMTDAASFSACTFAGGADIFHNNASITGCAINNMTDSSAITTLASYMVNLTDTSFSKTSGTVGHAINLGLVAQAGDDAITLNALTFTGYGTGTTGTFTGAITRDSAAMSVSVGAGNTFTINVDGNSTVPTIENLGTGDVVVTQAATVSLTRLLGNTEISVLDNPSPYSATSLPAPSITTVASTETVSANTFVGDNTNYYQINTGGTFVTIDAVGSAVFSTFPGVLSDTNASNPRALADGDKIRVVVRDDDTNPSLQLFDEFVVDADPTAPSTTSIITKTLSSGFTSVFGTAITGANSKTVTVEKVGARFQFSTPVGNVLDILAFRTGSDPILTLNNVAETGNIPLTQVGDRNYRDPA